MQRKVNNVLVSRMKLQKVVALSVVLLLTFANFHTSYHVDSLLIGIMGFNQQIDHVMVNKNLNRSM